MATSHFDLLMADNGGRLHASNCGDSAWKVIDASRGFLTVVLDSTKAIQLHAALHDDDWRMLPVGIEFDIVANTDVNAVAKANDIQEAFGLYFGLIRLIQRAFFALSSGAFFCPNVGDVDRGRESPKAIGDAILDRNLFADWGKPVSRDSARMGLAIDLGYVAELFVFFHELSHILYGHYLEPGLRVGEIAAVMEYRRDGLLPSRLSQAMEFDADEGAAARSIDFMIDTIETLGLFPGASLHDRIYYWALSIAVLFRLLDISSGSGEMKLYSSHPAPGPRLDHAIYCARARVDTTHPQHRSDFDSAVQSAMADAIAVWGELRIPARTHEFQEDRLKFAQELRAELLDCDVVLDPLMRERNQRMQGRWRSAPKDVPDRALLPDPCPFCQRK